MHVHFKNIELTGPHAEEKKQGNLIAVLSQ